MDHARKTQDSYDRLAALFFERHRDRSVLQAWMQRFSACVPQGGVVVDLGAGPCHDSHELRGLGLQVIALDRSAHMLRLTEREFPGPRVQADLRQLPFRARSIAGAWASASLLHLERHEFVPALASIADALAPRGVLFMSLKEGRSERWESSSYGVEAPRWFTYWTADDVDAALRASGFELVEAVTAPDAKETWLMRIARRREQR